MSQIVVSVNQVTKRFGKELILDHVSLRAEKGRICGIIGRNGSGKTVLFKCICGLLEADSGSIETDRSQIGTIIEAPGFLKFYSAEKNLRYLASLNGRQKDID